MGDEQATNRPVEWDSSAYDRISDPQYNWGRALLETITLHGDETVLDAGCGTGRLAEDLLARLPHGKLIALDSSANMIATARQRLARFGDRVEFVHADLSDFELAHPVDCIFSNAVFHWVPDHEALFENLFRVLKPGGWLLAQFGGEGNLQRLKQRVQQLLQTPEYARYFEDWKDGAHYESEAATVERMHATGFVEIESRIHGAPVSFPDRDSYATFIRKVNIHRYVAKLPPDEEEHLLDYLCDRAAQDDPPYTLDYVRLTLKARR
jgi:trans-aconitate methyltransferase